KSCMSQIDSSVRVAPLLAVSAVHWVLTAWGYCAYCWCKSYCSAYTHEHKKRIQMAFISPRDPGVGRSGGVRASSRADPGRGATDVQAQFDRLWVLAPDRQQRP